KGFPLAQVVDFLLVVLGAGGEVVGVVPVSEGGGHAGGAAAGEALSRPLDAGEDAAFEGVGGGLVAAEGDGEADVGVGDAVDAWGLRVGGAEEEREDQGDCEGGSFQRVPPMAGRPVGSRGARSRSWSRVR